MANEEQHSAGAGFTDLFGTIFGGGSRTGGRRGPQRARDVEAEVTLDLADAVHGATLPITLRAPGVCDTCHGNGAKPGTSPRPCPVCHGVGLVTSKQGEFSFSEPCRECQGVGTVVDEKCVECHGTGNTTKTRTLNVRIPAGVRDGQRIRITGRGEPGERGGPTGDLYLLAKVAGQPPQPAESASHHAPSPPSPSPSTPPSSAAVFISYRRSDSPYAAHRLSEHLVARFGEESIFIDMDAIEPGADFVETIERAVDGCRVMLVIIGPGWASATDDDGVRRLDKTNDYVRIEIEAALRRNATVIPILLDNTSMPAAERLPSTLQAFSRRNAFQLRLGTFRSDATALADIVDRALRRT